LLDSRGWYVLVSRFSCSSLEWSCFRSWCLWMGSMGL